MTRVLAAGVDVGMECTKAVILDGEQRILGRAIVATRGYFQDCALEAFTRAGEEAGVTPEEIPEICGTGFAPDRVPFVTRTVLDTTCHALAAWHHDPSPGTVVDIGGHVPKVITVGDGGSAADVRTARRCALGVGVFLSIVAKQLDIHPTRLEELAAGAGPPVDQRPATITSYCSVFAGTEVLERLRDGYSREQVARACITSIADRICEIGGFRAPVRVSGGVAAWFPGVVSALSSRIGIEAEVLPEPIITGALGAALKALSTHVSGGSVR